MVGLLRSSQHAQWSNKQTKYVRSHLAAELLEYSRRVAGRFCPAKLLRKLKGDEGTPLAIRIDHRKGQARASMNESKWEVVIRNASIYDGSGGVGRVAGDKVLVRVDAARNPEREGVTLKQLYDQWGVEQRASYLVASRRGGSVNLD